MDITDITILIIPGLGDSGEAHWQSHWLKQFPNAQKVYQANWDEPELNDWLMNLNKAIDSIHGPLIMVAHSLAVSLVAHWAEKYRSEKIKGALLVAPADVDSLAHTPDVVRSFAPMPVSPIVFPTIVAASDNDSFVDIARAEFFAKQWGSAFVNIGPAGHINAASKLNDWEEGKQLLRSLLQLYK